MPSVTTTHVASLRMSGHGLRSPDGAEMTDHEWRESTARSLGVFLGGAALDEIDDFGRRVGDAGEAGEAGGQNGESCSLHLAVSPSQNRMLRRNW